MESPSNARNQKSPVVTHALDPQDAAALAPIMTGARAAKGLPWTVDARAGFDAIMERVQTRDDVTFAPGTLAKVPGLWVRPRSTQPGTAILHLHGGWFSSGSANAYRHLVAQIAARAKAPAFVPDYRLAPEHPFPAAVDDVVAALRALNDGGKQRIAITGDSAGGNLALVLAARAESTIANVKGVAVVSPVTDLTLSGATYETRADADPLFTKAQVAGLVNSYLQGASADNPLASPLKGSLAGLPPIRIHVGDDEVLLDDSRRYAERAAAAGVDVRLDLWTGMPHGFVVYVGMLKASAEALDAIGLFLSERLGDGGPERRSESVVVH